jgi:flagellar secretion chaperone FliS
MLFDGLIESLSLARGHIQHGSIELKSRALQRASRIVLGLQNALDVERGGELARNLSDLYTYVVRRIIDINAYNDLKALDEVSSMMSEIRNAWQQVPSLVPTPALQHRMAS